MIQDDYFGSCHKNCYTAKAVLKINNRQYETSNCSLGLSGHDGHHDSREEAISLPV